MQDSPEEVCSVCGQRHECPGSSVTPAVVVQILTGAPNQPGPRQGEGPADRGPPIQDFSHRVSKKIKRLTGRKDENIQDEPE